MKKKLLLLGSLITPVAPIAAVISCGESTPPTPAPRDNTAGTLTTGITQTDTSTTTTGTNTGTTQTTSTVLPGTGTSGTGTVTPIVTPPATNPPIVAPQTGLVKPTLLAYTTGNLAPTTLSGVNGKAGFTLSGFDSNTMSISASHGVVDTINNQVTGLLSGQSTVVSITPKPGQTWTDATRTPVMVTLTAPVFTAAIIPPVVTPVVTPPTTNPPATDPLVHIPGLPLVTIVKDLDASVRPTSRTNHDGEMVIHVQNFDSSKMSMTSSKGTIDLVHNRITGLKSTEVIEVTVSLNPGENWDGGSTEPLKILLISPGSLTSEKLFSVTPEAIANSQKVNQDVPLASSTHVTTTGSETPGAASGTRFEVPSDPLIKNGYKSVRDLSFLSYKYNAANPILVDNVNATEGIDSWKNKIDAKINQILIDNNIPARLKGFGSTHGDGDLYINYFNLAQTGPFLSGLNELTKSIQFEVKMFTESGQLEGHFNPYSGVAFMNIKIQFSDAVFASISRDIKKIIDHYATHTSAATPTGTGGSGGFALFAQIAGATGGQTVNTGNPVQGITSRAISEICDPASLKSALAGHLKDFLDPSTTTSQIGTPGSVSFEYDDKYVFGTFGSLYRYIADMGVMSEDSFKARLDPLATDLDLTRGGSTLRSDFQTWFHNKLGGTIDASKISIDLVYAETSTTTGAITSLLGATKKIVVHYIVKYEDTPGHFRYMKCTINAVGFISNDQMITSTSSGISIHTSTGNIDLMDTKAIFDKVIT